MTQIPTEHFTRPRLYDDIRELAHGMEGPWLKRLAYAENCRRSLRERLKSEGLWLPVSSECWLASWRGEGGSFASWLDESTLGWPAEEAWGDDTWVAQIRRLRRPWYRSVIKLRNWTARMLEAPIASLAVLLWPTGPT